MPCWMGGFEEYCIEFVVKFLMPCWVKGFEEYCIEFVVKFLIQRFDAILDEILY